MCHNCFLQSARRPVMEIRSRHPKSQEGGSVKTAQWRAQPLAARWLESAHIVKYTNGAVREFRTGVTLRAVLLLENCPPGQRRTSGGSVGVPIRAIAM